MKIGITNFRTHLGISIEIYTAASKILRNFCAGRKKERPLHPFPKNPGFPSRTCSRLGAPVARARARFMHLGRERSRLEDVMRDETREENNAIKGTTKKRSGRA